MTYAKDTDFAPKPPVLDAPFSSVAGIEEMPMSYERGEEIPITWFAAVTTYLGFAVLNFFGRFRDFFAGCVRFA